MLQAPRVLRVLTLNIWNLSGGWRGRRAEIVRWLDRLSPDVVCLQEVVELADGRNQARWLAGAAGTGDAPYHLAYGPAHVAEAEGWSFGNAVLSRWPIESAEVSALPYEPKPGEEQRVLLHARTNGLDVFCTHLNWQYADGALREQQVGAIDRVVAGRADPASPLPPILAGDFNAEPDSTEMRFLLGLTSLGGRSTYFQDAWRVAGNGGPGWTWDNRNPFAAAEHEPDRRIDYVLVGWRRPDGAGRVEAARVTCDRSLTGTQASDHYGLAADLATGASWPA